MQLPWLLLAALSQPPSVDAVLPSRVEQAKHEVPRVEQVEQVETQTANAIAQQQPKPKPKPKPKPSPDYCPPCGRG